MSPEEIIKANEAFAPEPDLLIILDLPCREGLGRIYSRGDKPNTFEKEDILISRATYFCRSSVHTLVW